MLKYWKNHQEVACDAIYGTGRVGQLVVWDTVLPEDMISEYPLARYPRPYFFTITEKVEGKSGYYTVSDAEGLHIKLQSESYGASDSFLYDAIEWSVWHEEHEKEMLTRKQGRIEHLESQVALLKSILIGQGVRIITPEQAKALGIG